MKLEKVNVNGFKSVQDSIDFYVRSRITCLIGANEHGKSNLLRTIHLLGEEKLEETDKNSVLYKKSGLPNIIYEFSISVDEKKILQAMLTDLVATIKSIQEISNEDKVFLVLSEKLLTLLKDKDKEIKLNLKLSTTGRMFISPNGLNLLYGADKNPNLKNWLLELLPKTFLFSPSNQIADTISLEELNNRSNIEFEGLLKLSGVWEEKESLFEDGSQADGLRIKTSRKLTSKIRTLWSQGSSNYNFQLTLQSGPRLALTIEDKTGNFDSPSQRSLGFKAFFSFYSAIYAETYSVSPEGYIFLFDEPDVHLHPQAQKDLLRELRKLSKNNQIVFATHSPFMMDRNDLQSTLVVKKETEGTKKGTQVNHKPYRNNWSAARESLGIMMGDNLFYSNKSLFVEGTSDRIYILSILNNLKPRPDMDLNYLTILDGDKRSEMYGIAQILLREGRGLLALVDGDKGGEVIGKQLLELKKTIKKADIEILNLKSIFKNNSVSIENFLPIREYCIAVNKYLLQYHGKEIKDLEKKLISEESSKTRGKATVLLAIKEGVIKEESNFSKTTTASFYDLDVSSSKKTIQFPKESQALVLILKEKLNL